MMLSTHLTWILAPTWHGDGPGLPTLVTALVDASSPAAARSRVETSCRLAGWPRGTSGAYRDLLAPGLSAE